MITYSVQSSGYLSLTNFSTLDGLFDPI